MSDDMDREDRTLGAALSRAIETQPTRETPYARSRLAQRIAQPRRGSIWAWTPVAAAAALVATVALAAATFGAPRDRDPVAAPMPSPTATAPATPSAATAPPAQVPPDRDAVTLYFGREGLPPVRATLRTVLTGRDSAEGRILGRLSALFSRVPDSDVPPGSRNFARVFDPVVEGRSTRTINVRVTGDVATVEFVEPFAVRPRSEQAAFVAQLVFTVTEEPGIRRVRLVGPGGQPLGLEHAQGRVDERPLAREDVTGYLMARATQQVIEGGDGGVRATLDGLRGLRASVDQVAPGLGRTVIELVDAPAGRTPRFTVRPRWIESAGGELRGRWVLDIDLPEVLWRQGPGEAFHCCPVLPVERAPLERITVAPKGAPGDHRNIGITVHLTDLRPWRVAVLPDPLRLVVDVGGPPVAVSEAIAVYDPAPGAEVDRTFTVRGLARTFEANVQWRLRDGSGRALASGFTTASIGTSVLWGTFETTVTAPAGTRGDVVLEVFETSARDGSEIHKVSIPLRIR